MSRFVLVTLAVVLVALLVPLSRNLNLIGYARHLGLIFRQFDSALRSQPLFAENSEPDGPTNLKPLDAAPSHASKQEQQHENEHPGPPLTQPFEPAPVPAQVTKHRLWWFAPFLSGGGYCSEAMAFVLALRNIVPNLRISHFADSVNAQFVESIDPADFRIFESMHAAQHVTPSRAVVVCHSEPGAWLPPLYNTYPCPLPGPRPRYVIGRTMFETDRIPNGWHQRLNQMDEVWVPSKFGAETFLENGVDPEKIVVIPEPIDTDLYDPAVVERLPLPFEGSEFVPITSNCEASDHVFVSVFKMEPRKNSKLGKNSTGLEHFISRISSRIFSRGSRLSSGAILGLPHRTPCSRTYRRIHFEHSRIYRSWPIVASHCADR
eukprot:c18570_g1_i4.p1 GENE.c18570_g1_i4~~c18570_g1_i4.p1  ORF type:complete len:377 (+),score=52.40 c18570_g1_i4:427-1557(+)